MKTLEKLLRMTVPVGSGCIVPENTPMTPCFRVAVQEINDMSIRIIVHASGYDSDTLDFVVMGNKLLTLEQYKCRYDKIASRVFELSSSAQAIAEQFIVTHECPAHYAGAVGGKISYEFTETSAGVIETVKCSCGRSQDLTDYSKW